MNIILADHDIQYRNMIRALLEREATFDLVGEADGGQALLDLADSKDCQLVLIDRELPGVSLETLIAHLRAANHPPIIVVMSSDIEYSRETLKNGADAFLSKSDLPEWLLDTLDKYASRLQIEEEEFENGRFRPAQSSDAKGS